MECLMCKNGTTKPGLVNVPIVRDDKIIFFKKIPAEICDNCGEYYIDSEIARQIYEKADERMKEGVEMEVTQYQP